MDRRFLKARSEPVAGSLLFALAAYVVIAAGWKLWIQTGETFFWPGLVVTLLAMPMMYLCAWQGQVHGCGLLVGSSRTGVGMIHGGDCAQGSLPIVRRS